MSRADRSFLVLICLVLAAIVMLTGHDGWGWLLFIAFILI
ncbi:hypothetical protein Y590_25015 (plasmid) [Methylobacterium sp. AMS5]|nr:hypothetical protein Y590_25015 [Methylobacterium sp. AMS5]